MRFWPRTAQPLHTAITGISTFADMLAKNSKRIENLIGGLEKLTGVGGTKETLTVYDLAAPTSFPPLSKKIEKQMVVADPNAIVTFDTQKILIKTADGTFTDVHDARWADNLPKLVQARSSRASKTPSSLAR